MIIVDANLVGALFVQSDQSTLATRIFEKDPDWYAPLLWQSEMRSLITGYLRHSLMTLDKATQIMDEAHGLMMEHERFISSNLVLELVSTSKCTAYDCEYVALAKEMNLTLVTLDKEIVREFPGIAVFPQNFVNI
ncbi:MAG TPA: type II toxin-antitoxin system VapC family toxin [Anaerolineales bacterium]|nr:type II toxin-antitoxin system VapC family toxin [Anaerolineales bacterium]HLO32519.1 type II toxin-antitoxin system VapC family toxin [Anaerolineales bacterium]